MLERGIIRVYFYEDTRERDRESVCVVGNLMCTEEGREKERERGRREKKREGERERV